MSVIVIGDGLSVAAGVDDIIDIDDHIHVIG